MVKILIAEDDQELSQLFAHVLTKNGFLAQVVSNGKEALEALEKDYFDLLISDIMMPKMDGYEFTKTLRDVNNNLPILMISAKQLPEDKRRGFLVGIDDYMTKPLDEVEMLLRIKALLRRAKIATEHKIVIGSVVIDYDAMTVTKDGETQELPQKEF